MKRLIPVLTLAVSLTAGTALADVYGYVNLTFNGANDLLGHASPGVTVNGEGTSAGPYDFTLSNPSNNIPPLGIALPKTVSGFCIDFNQNISGGLYTNFKVSDLSDATINLDITGTLAGQQTTVKSDILKLMTEYLASNGANTLVNPTTSTDSTALTLAIWAVLAADPTKPLNAPGGLSVTGLQTTAYSDATAIAGANAFLLGMNAAAPYNGHVYALTDPTSQDQVISLAGDFLLSPEPSGLVPLAGLGALGLPFGLVMVYRRKRQIA